MPSFDAPSGQSLLLIKLHVLFFFYFFHAAQHLRSLACRTAPENWQNKLT